MITHPSIRLLYLMCCAYFSTDSSERVSGKGAVGGATFTTSDLSVSRSAQVAEGMVAHAGGGAGNAEVDRDDDGDNSTAVAGLEIGLDEAAVAAAAAAAAEGESLMPGGESLGAEAGTAANSREIQVYTIASAAGGADGNNGDNGADDGDDDDSTAVAGVGIGLDGAAAAAVAAAVAEDEPSLPKGESLGAEGRTAANIREIQVWSGSLFIFRDRRFSSVALCWGYRFTSHP